jgi:hypothetical protein
MKVATIYKINRQQLNKIQRLEHDAEIKAERLKRKDEEVKRLKEVQARRQTIFEVNRHEKNTRRAAVAIALGKGKSKKQEIAAPEQKNEAWADTTFTINTNTVPVR